MKKLMYLFVSLALVALAACGDKDGEQTEKPPVEEPEKPEEEPQPEPGLPFTEYSLEGTSSYWTNLNLNGEPIIVNSSEELQQYIVGTDYPPVDFSKHTLISAKGTTSTGVSVRSFSFQQLSVNEYQLNVVLNWTDATVVGRWNVAIVVDKLNGNSNIKLEVK